MGYDMLASCFPRRCAALIAAYAIALQALLSAFAAMPVQARGTDPAWALCVTEAGGKPAPSRAHETCGACLAGHCGAGALAAPAGAVTAWRWPAFTGPTLALSRPADVPALSSRDEPHSPRAPPLS
jgi:hypothetical protein